MKKRIIAAFAAVVMLCAVPFAGCGGRSIGDTEQSLEVYVWDAGYGSQWMWDMLDAFAEQDWVQEKYPELEYDVTANDLNNFASDRINSGTTTIDLFNGANIGTLWETGNLLDITETVYNQKVPGEDVYFKDKMPASILESVAAPTSTEEDMQYFATPGPSAMGGFVYNVTLFDELGLEVPENWDEFIAVLDVLKGSGYIPISLGNIEDWATGHYMTTLNQRVVPADTLAADYALEGDFTAPEYVTALEYLEKLVPYFTPEFNSVTYDAGINDFISGKAAIYYEQFNQVQYIMPAEFNWSWFDFPDIEGAAGDQNALTGSPQGLMVSSTTKYPEACIKFLKYLTNFENSEKLVAEAQMFSCVDGAINENSANEKMSLMAETIKNAPTINPWLDNATDSEVVTTYQASIQAMVGGAKTAEEVMADVQAKVAQVKAEM